MHHALRRLSTIYKYQGMAGVWQRLKSRLAPPRRGENRAGALDKEFLSQHTPSVEALEAIREEQAKLSYRPTISVILPVFDPEPRLLKETIESVLSQIYPDWELCIADDNSSNPKIRSLLESFSKTDTRIKIIFREARGHISAASNSALTIASGEFMVLLDHDDLLAPQALYELVVALQGEELPDLVYSNEDKVDARGNHSEPACKPGWSFPLFRSHMYVGHLTMYPTELVRELGGFRKGFEGSQDYNLALRVAEKSSRIIHVPKVLYHWRKHEHSVSQNIGAKVYAFEVAKKALRESVERVEGQTVSVDDGMYPGVYRIRYSLPRDPSVAVFFWGEGEGTLNCTNAVRKRAPTQSSVDQVSLSQKEVIDRQELLEAVMKSEAEFILLLHRGFLPKQDRWLEDLLEPLQTDKVGAVAPRILNASGKTVLQAGLIVEEGRLYSNFFGASVFEGGYGLRLYTGGEVSALSLYCVVMKRSVLQGTLTGVPQFASHEAFAVWLSFRLRSDGYTLWWTPYVSFVGAVDRSVWKQYDLHDSPKDLGYLEQEFQLQSCQDPFYPVGLNRNIFDYTLSK